MQHLPLHPVVVPDPLHRRVERLAGLEIETDRVTIRLLVLQRNDCVLHIEAAVLRERLRDDQQRVRERLHAHLRAPLRAALYRARQVRRARHLERACAGDERLVLECVLDRAKAVTDGVLDLLDGVRVRALDEESDGFGVLDLLNKGKLLLAESVLVDEASPAEDGRVEVVERVLRLAAADEL